MAFHGTDDKLVSFEKSQQLFSNLKTKYRFEKVEFYHEEGAGHEITRLTRSLIKDFLFKIIGKL